MNQLPIIPGFHPDPSICRVGDDYYLVTSTFEYLPGVPIFHSTDLVNWQQIGNVLDRPSQLSLPSSDGSRGIFAPTIRHHDGRFYMITTNINRVAEGQMIVSAENAAGPWTDPVIVSGSAGIDPDLFWDADGTCYMTWKADGRELPINQVIVDPDTGAMLSEPVGLSAGTGLAFPEAPHVFRRGDWFYLVMAEGGTERGHTVTIARSRSVSGPYEMNPSNPILTHRSLRNPVQNTGHADFVETPDGWAMVFLGVRPVGPIPGFHLIGREAFVAGVNWVDDWPVVDESTYEVAAHRSEFMDDFSEDGLDPSWVAPGRHPHEFVTKQDDGALQITPPPSDAYASLLARRVTDLDWEAKAVVDAGTARLVLRMDQNHWAAVETHGDNVIATAQIGPFVQELGRASDLPDSPVTLMIRSTQPHIQPDGFPNVADDLALGYEAADGFVALTTFDGRYLSSEVASGFTGRVVGIEPLTGSGAPGVLHRFEYRSL